MSRSFTDDERFDSDSINNEFDDLDYEHTDKRRCKARKRLDDYLEQRRLRKSLGDDEFGDID